MGFCVKCGEELTENANFCPKCGNRTSKGKEANVSIPWEGMFFEVGEELERAFSVAGKELKKAFDTAREEIKHATNREFPICINCGAKNSPEARFCQKCGKAL